MREKHPSEAKETYQEMQGLSRSVKTVNELASSPRHQQTAGNRTVVSTSLNIGTKSQRNDQQQLKNVMI